MRRHAFLFGLALVLTHGSLSYGAYAQQADKMPRVGVVLNSPVTSPPCQAFLQGLHDLGYVEDKNVAIVAKSAEGNYERISELARELARLNVNVMVVSGDQGLRAAKDATATIPIIVVSCGPLDSLFVSIARPGGKATGLSCIPRRWQAKGFSCLRATCQSNSQRASSWS
jgi:putative tryptophan/tyrosine transport system substrate-binding protein